MRFVSPFIAVFALMPLAVRAEPANAHLALAEKLVSELKFQDSVAELEQAWAVHENPRATVLRILELQGIAAGSLRQGKRAEGFFRKLVMLDPSHTLSSDYAPRVLTPFYEAKNWVNDHGALRFTAGKAMGDDKLIHGVRVMVKADAFGAQRVRFHVRPGGGPWNTLDIPLDGGQALARIEGKSVEWWAELIGERDAQLALVGSPTAPVLEQVAPKVVPAPPPTSSPVPLANAAAVQVRAAEPAANYRPLSYGLLLGGVASAGLAAYFGAKANHDITQSNNAALQSSAASLANSAKNSALTANVLFGTAAALVLGGGLTWWLAPHGPQATLALGPQGAVVTGAF